MAVFRFRSMLLFLIMRSTLRCKWVHWCTGPQLCDRSVSGSFLEPYFFCFFMLVVRGSGCFAGAENLYKRPIDLLVLVYMIHTFL
ncbi:hypothetical protein BD769DRAFT_384654 [Suillus cothurnatus]|nr:hypothetical protein BD769DRAFT_384654 [Suillus cothurnatus]